MGFKKTYRLVLEFTAEMDDTLQIAPGWEGNTPEEQALRERTERDLHAALLSTHQEQLKQLLLVDMVGQVSGGLSWDEVIRSFPSIDIPSPDHAALAKVAADLPPEERQFLIDMEDEGVLAESVMDLYDAYDAKLQSVTLEEV